MTPSATDAPSIAMVPESCNALIGSAGGSMRSVGTVSAPVSSVVNCCPARVQDMSAGVSEKL